MLTFRVRELSPLTGLLICTCDEIPGLLVHGRSENEVLQKLPGALAQMRELRAAEKGKRS